MEYSLLTVAIIISECQYSRPIFCYTYLMLLLIFACEMILMFFLSHWLNKTIFLLFYRLSRSQHVAYSITALLLFPGTIVHELSHLFVAEILGVRTGKLTLIPEYIEDKRIQAGSVEVSATDPFRRTIIGLAPLIIGVITITLLSSYVSQLFPHALDTAQSADRLQHPIIYTFTLCIYLLFAVSNNMFPSKADMHGVFAVLLFLILVIGAAYTAGARFIIGGTALAFVVSILSSLTTNLAVVIILNVILLVFFRIMLMMTKR
jgi:hypothetical protein